MKCARCGTELSGNLAACPVCLLSDSPHPTPPPASRGEGAKLGKLKLLEEIGRGGMGTVWRARHAALDRTVAVKLLPEHLAKEPEFRARFEREAKALALLDHPNIVRVHDYGQEDGKSFIVLELVEGTTLAKAIPLSIERALEVASELLSALSYAHGKGVVHRDVKPQNVLLDRDGRVKVTDFGIARIVHGTETDWRVTASNVAVGTPGYLAPEALAGAPPDPRRDIYAVGVVLYEMVTGKLPIGSFDPPPEPLRPIVARALSASVEGRYPTAEAMRADIERARATRATGALPPDELAWMRATALLQAVSTAVALKAFLECITPKVVDHIDPLVFGYFEPTGDGRFKSYARFEAVWVIAAVATFVPAITAYGFLRRHWRLAGLERHDPETPVPQAKTVLLVGAGCIALQIVHTIADATGQGRLIGSYMPILGGAVLFSMLYFLWTTILECWRRERPLPSERLAWLGVVLAVFPPVVHWFLYASRWKP